jgi:hypothetical protein
MASIESLPPDQRAVLELVLRRGRSYDEIAQLLSIDRAGVRQRALNALDALGPEAGVPAERRALITDYLLSALPPRVTEQVRERLAESPGERAWARVIAAELEPIAAHPLPEIPAAGDIAPAQAAAPPAVAPPEPETRRLPRRPAREAEAPEAKPRRRGLRLGGPELKLPSRPKRRKEALGPRPALEPGRQRPPSRRGGMFVLVAAGLIVLAIILIVALGGGGNSKNTPSTPGSTNAQGPLTSSTPTTASTPTTGTNGSGQLVAQINLNPPSGGSAKGVADVVRSGSTQGLEIVASGLKANTKTNAYAVWLYNSPADSHLLGFVNPAVGSNGNLRTVGTLPSNASHFGQILITLETQAKPTSPGTIILQGQLKGLS